MTCCRAALTGIDCAVAYVGFRLPTAVAVAGRWLTTATELGALAAVALGATLVILTGRNILVPEVEAGQPTWR